MKILSCAFNIDAARVELKFADRSMIAIDTIAVENLDWLIYNAPTEYASLVLSGEVENYLWGQPLHGMNN